MQVIHQHLAPFFKALWEAIVPAFATYESEVINGDEAAKGYDSDGELLLVAPFLDPIRGACHRCITDSEWAARFAGDLIGVGPFLREAFEFLFVAADVEKLRPLLEPALGDLAFLLLGYEWTLGWLG